MSMKDQENSGQERPKEKMRHRQGDSLILFIRFIMPVVLLCILSLRICSTYIPVLNIEISETVMQCISIVLHLTSMFCGLHETCPRGYLYELSCSFLASEIILFLCFIQYQFAAACTLLGVLICFFVLLLIYARKELGLMYFSASLPPPLVDDMIASLKSNGTERSCFLVALRRYMTIAAAILLSVPALLTLIVYCKEDSVKHTGQTHAVIETSNANQMLLNMDTIRLFQDELWNGLSEQERIDALQVVADIETNHLGIAPVVVSNKSLEAHITGGYQHSQRAVYIDMSKHSDDESIEAIITILHECRHAFQHDCVDSLDWEDQATQTGIYYAQARQWRYEQAHYISISESMDGYYDQEVEKDAKQYADEGIGTYWQYISLSDLPAR